MKLLLYFLSLLKKAIRINKIFSPARIMVFGFLIIIFLGALLLSLPISSKDGDSISFLTALFTSVSATCVTGLVVVDTYNTWSIFGRIVILCLIQIGGLGFMSIMTIFFFLTSRRISISQRLLIVQSLSLKDIKGVVRLVRHVLIGTFIIEFIGAIILWIRFSFDFSLWEALGLGIFHSISAFCNAGFDLFGKTSPFSSLTSYSGDFIVSFTIMILIILGGIGFFVWEDIFLNRKFKKLHLHSKMVITITIILIVSGWILFYAAEINNPETIGGMSTPNALLASLFQSVSPRTAGFNSIDQSALTDVSKHITMILMFIGGSAGSTAGGIKTVTAGIIFLAAFNSLRGKTQITAFERTIPSSQVTDAIAVTVFSLSLCIGCSIFISIVQNIPYYDVLFETISALGTVGLSLGITPTLSSFSQIIIICLMFFGRVGIMTIAMASILNRNKHEKIKYPDAWIMMG